MPGGQILENFEVVHLSGVNLRGVTGGVKFFEIFRGVNQIFVHLGGVNGVFQPF